MIRAAMGMELRLRARMVILASLGLIAITAITGALFPAFGESLGGVDLPEGVSGLIGTGDFTTIAGWLNTEVVSVYGPLVVAGVGIVAAAATTAGEEEARILALVLAHPVDRTRLLVAKAAGVALPLVALGVAAWAGLALAVVLAGGGVGAGRLAAQALHLTGLALALASVALALGASTGRRSVATGGGATVAVLMFLVNGLAPTVAGLAWLRYLSAFHYYSGSEPLTTGVHVGDLAALLGFAAVLTLAAIGGFAGRDLRA